MLSIPYVPTPPRFHLHQFALSLDLDLPSHGTASQGSAVTPGDETLKTFRGYTVLSCTYNESHTLEKSPSAQ